MWRTWCRSIGLRRVYCRGRLEPRAEVVVSRGSRTCAVQWIPKAQVSAQKVPVISYIVACSW